MSSGCIFNIQRFSTHDGPGIRTTVFLEGCPLRCFWCQNPESQSARPVLMYNVDRCIACGTCTGVCPHSVPTIAPGSEHVEFDRKQCDACGACAENCPVEAVSISGYTATAEQVVEEVMKDYLQYMDSGGGVTLSGGEPLLQPEFARDILRLCKENGLHTLIETCGHVPWTSFETVLPYVDEFFWDIKKIDPQAHKAATGVDNGLILENAVRMAKAGKKVCFRMPLIPGFNDSENDVRLLVDFVLKKAGRTKDDIALLRYNNLGEEKFRRLGKTDVPQYQPQPEEYVDHLLEIIQNTGE